MLFYVIYTFGDTVCYRWSLVRDQITDTRGTLYNWLN